MKAINAYNSFIRLEERSAALYMELSIRFFNNPGLSWFWIQMGMEQKQHAGMLQHCRESGTFAAELPNGDEIRSLDRLLQHLEARLSHPELTLDDAFDMATALETSELGDVYDKLTASIDGPARVMQKKMELSGTRQFRRLYDAACAFHASSRVQTRLIGLLSGGGPEPGTGV